MPRLLAAGITEARLPILYFVASNRASIEHINRLGRYEFNLAAETIKTNLSALPLRSAAMMADQFGLNN
jgi:hypothetical protein